MKKILIGSLSAISAAFGFTSFKGAKMTTTTYYWFVINAGDASQSNSPQSSLANSEMSFLIKTTTVSDASSICDGVENWHCLVGYTASLVTASGSFYKLKSNFGIPPTTAPRGVDNYQYSRNTE